LPDFEFLGECHLNKFSYELYNQVKDLSGLGTNNYEIAKRFGLNEITVKKLLATSFADLNRENHNDDVTIEVFEKEKLSDRNLTIIKLRKNGKTLEEIGSQTNLTRERVRQILEEHAPEIDLVEMRSQKKLEKVIEFKRHSDEIHKLITANWNEYKSLRLDDIARIFEVPEWRIRSCVSPIQNAYLKANEESKIDKGWSDDQCLASLRNAATYAFPITVTKYKKLLESGEIDGPTMALFFQRFGSWVKACQLAGVEYGDAQREYDRTWNNTELITFVRRFMHFRLDGKWSPQKYEEWRRLPTVDGPSLPLLRLRFGLWSEIRVLALELDTPEYDMEYFTELRINEK
jgi:DNA-binding CsgD family transcriptional regulator